MGSKILGRNTAKKQSGSTAERIDKESKDALEEVFDELIVNKMKEQIEEVKRAEKERDENAPGVLGKVIEEKLALLEGAVGDVKDAINNAELDEISNQISGIVPAVGDKLNTVVAKQVDELKTSVGNMTDRLDNLKEEMATKIAPVTKSLTDLTEMKNHLSAINSNIQKLDDISTRINGIVPAVGDKLNTVVAEQVDELKTSVRDMTNHMTGDLKGEMGKKIAPVTQDLAEVKNQLSEINSNIQKLDDISKQIDGIVPAVEEKLDAVVAEQVGKLETSVGNMTDRLDNHLKEEMAEKLIPAGSQLTSVEGSIAEIRAELAALQTQKNPLWAKLAFASLLATNIIMILLQLLC